LIQRIPKVFTTWITIGITLFFLYLSFRKIDLERLGEAISSASMWHLILAAALNLLAMIIRSAKLKIVFAPVKHISFLRAFSATMICFSLSNILPLRAGEAAKLYVLNRTEQLGYGRTIGAVGFDRILEAVGLFLVTVVILLLYSAPGWLIAAGLAVSGFGVVMFALTLVGVKFLEQLEEAASASGLLARFADFVRLMVVGARAIQVPRVTIKAILVGLVLWNTHAVVVFVTMQAFGFTPGYLFSFVVLIAVNVLLMMPSGPATFGPFEYGCVLSLALIGIGKTDALSFALLYHLLQVIPVTLIGLYFLWKEDLTLGRARRLDLYELHQRARRELTAEKRATPEARER
jgi:uncharacterized protein (TIRG00374 family)